MSKARRVSKILDGELKTDEIGLTNPTREAKSDIPAGLESQKDANLLIGERLDALETPEGLPEHTHDFADKDHTHPKQDFDHDHDSEYAQRTHLHDSNYASASHSHDHKYEQLNHATSEHQRLDDKIDNHAGTQHNFLPLAGGEMGPSAKIDWPSNTGVVDGLQAAYKDQMPVRKKEFDEAVGGLSDSAHDHPHDHDSAYAPAGHTHDADTAPHTHDEYQAKGDYAAGDHDHPPQDFTHDHDGTYSPENHHHNLDYAPIHPHPYAADDHTHAPQDLTHDHDSEYAPIHEHPYASDTHDHDADYAPISHDHDDYFSKGSAADEHGNPLPLPYGDAMELGAAVDDVKEENGEQNDRLDALEAAAPVAIGDNPPSDEKSKDGDLWWDSVRMEMFIRYQDAWITTNALSARVEAGEQVQADLLARVAVGEEQQVILQDKVRALEGAVGEHPFQFLTNNSPRPGQFVMIDRNGQPTGTVADVLYLMFPTTDHNNDDVDLGRLSEGDLLRLSSPNGGVVEFKSGADANSDSFLVDSVVRADFDTLIDGVVYGATYLSQFDPSGLATIVYVDAATSTLAQQNTMQNGQIQRLSSDKADTDHLHPYAHRDDVDMIPRPLTWKFMGTSTPAQDLGPGEFTIATTGDQNTSTGKFKIYLHPRDSSGRQIVSAVTFSHDFSNNFMVSVQQVGGGGGITGKSQNFYFNTDTANKYHRLETNWWKVAYTLVNNAEYIIQVPGILPTFGFASAFSTLSIEEEVDGEVPASDEQEEQVND